jgi:glycosyltransferase involved in cell wall biosynthesis
MTADCLGGVWDHALTLAGELGRRGHRVDLAVLGGPLAADQRDRAASVPGLTLFDSVWGLEWMPDRGDDVAASGDWLLRLEQERQPDLVHVNGYAHAALAFRAPVLCAAHSCVVGWFAAVRGAEPPAAFDSYRDGVEAGLAAAGLVVAPSRAMAAELAFHHGHGGPVTVIPNGVDPQGHRVGPKDLHVLSAGRVWDAAKNMHSLDAVAPGLAAPVLVAGEGCGPDGVGARLTHARALGRLPAEAMREAYARASVFCLPALYEPFGIAALEAALSGCALVLGDIPSQRELWGEAALLVPPGDGEALRRALNGLLCDPGRRADLAAAAAIRARRYTASAMADGYLDAYATLMSGRGRSDAVAA